MNNQKKKEESKTNPSSSSENKKDEHFHVDVADIIEMDYSPARRKPPIHN